jgi:hypothetical protein
MVVGIQHHVWSERSRGQHRSVPGGEHVTGVRLCGVDVALGHVGVSVKNVQGAVVIGGTEIHIINAVVIHVPSMRHRGAQLGACRIAADSVANGPSLQISQVDVVHLLCVCAVDHVHAAHVVAELRVCPRSSQHQVGEAVAVEVRGVADGGAKKVGSGGAVKADNRVLGVVSEVDVLHVLRAVDQVRSAGPCPAFGLATGAADQEVPDAVTVHVARAADGGAEVVTSPGSSDHYSSSIEIVSEVDVDHRL